VRKLDAQGKLLYVYLFTNSKCNISGAYEVTIADVVLETGIDAAEVTQLLRNFALKKKIIFKKNWMVVTKFIDHQRLNDSVIKGIQRVAADAPDWVREFILDRLSTVCHIPHSTLPIGASPDGTHSTLPNGARRDRTAAATTEKNQRENETSLTPTPPMEDPPVDRSVTQAALAVENGNRKITCSTSRGKLIEPATAADALEVLEAAFPDIPFTTSHLDAIKAEVDWSNLDHRKAWGEAVRRYLLNHDPLRNRYDPTKMWNVLNCFEEALEKLEVNDGKGINGGKRSNSEKRRRSADYFKRLYGGNGNGSH
jgi:hypothetical protein